MRHLSRPGRPVARPLKAAGLAVAALAALGVAGPAVAPLGAQQAPADRQRVIEELREILKADPTILRDAFRANPEILGDAIAAYEDWQQRKQGEEQKAFLAANRETLERSRHGAVIGNPQGDIVLVEFLDYNCGFCAQMLPVLVDLMKVEPRLKIVLKDLPVIRRESVDAARVAIALKKQFDAAKYLRFHQTLMAMRGVKTRVEALAVARDLGADMAKLEADMAGPDVEAALVENEQLATGLKLTGTPSYVLGDTFIAGAVGFQRLKERIDELKACKERSC